MRLDGSVVVDECSCVPNLYVVHCITWPFEEYEAWWECCGGWLPMSLSPLRGALYYLAIWRIWGLMGVLWWMIAHVSLASTWCTVLPGHLKNMRLDGSVVVDDCPSLSSLYVVHCITWPFGEYEALWECCGGWLPMYLQPLRGALYCLAIWRIWGFMGVLWWMITHVSPASRGALHYLAIWRIWGLMGVLWWMIAHVSPTSTWCTVLPGHLKNMRLYGSVVVEDCPCIFSLYVVHCITWPFEEYEAWWECCGGWLPMSLQPLRGALHYLAISRIWGLMGVLWWMIAHVSPTSTWSPTALSRSNPTAWSGRILFKF